MLKQYLKEHYLANHKALYVTLDDFWFTNHHLIDVAESCQNWTWHDFRSQDFAKVSRLSPLWLVGGKNKKFDQIKDVSKSFLAVDDIDTGFGDKISLWMFGLLE